MLRGTMNFNTQFLDFQAVTSVEHSESQKLAKLTLNAIANDRIARRYT